MPGLFDRFLGNKPVKELLQTLLADGRLPHAILLEGGKGLGKKTLAGYVAAAVFCKAECKPCGECASCRKVLSGNHPDVRLFLSEGAKSFHVDTIRTIQSEAYIAPNEADVKLYILCDAQNMTESAQNALLKIIENPPAHVMFILTAVNAQRLLPTIRSRCTLFRLSPVPAEEAYRYLKAKFPAWEEQSLRLVLQLFGGNLGKGAAFFEDKDSEKLLQKTVDVLQNLQSQGFELLSAVNEAAKSKDMFLGFLGLFKQMANEILCGRGGEALPKLDGGRALSAITAADQTSDYLLQNVNLQLAVTYFVAALERKSLGVL